MVFTYPEVVRGVPWTGAWEKVFIEKRWKQKRELLIIYSVKPSWILVIRCPWVLIL